MATNFVTNRRSAGSTHFLAVVRWLVGGLVLLASLGAGAQIPTPEILYYKFNESGTEVTNQASAPPSGTTTATILGGSFTQNNSFSATTQALAGTGVSASTDYVNTGWAPSITGDWSLSFFTSNIEPSATLWYIFGDLNTSSLRCFTNGVAGPNNWILRGPITDVLITGGADANPHMITFVYSQASAAIQGYLDATLVTTVAQGSISLVGTGPFKVGGYANSSTLNGKMADFRFYSHALTAADITNIYNYVMHTFFVGGSVTGTPGAGLTLQNNNGDDLPIAADGSFQFATPLLDATTYDVTVSVQPPGQVCTVSNGSGTVAAANVTDVSVNCIATPTDLVVTVDDGLSYVRYGQPINYLVTLTNNGGTTASDVTVSSSVSFLGSDVAQWNCTPGGGATCTASGTGPFGDTVTVPFNGSLTWIVNMPALLSGDYAEFNVVAPGTSASDIDTLVVFRDGFE